MKKLVFFCAFGCVGITTEIFFTAIVDTLHLMGTDLFNWRLKGVSYIWMFPIYGIAGLVFPPVIEKLKSINVLIRMAIYAIGILTVEFITGAMLELFTGVCPWKYQTGWHIMGYIRLDYFPLWAGFGLMVEQLVLFLQKTLRV